MTDAPKHPETAALAREALEASGAKTHREFLDIVGGAIALRVFRYWLSGDRPADKLAMLVLREIKAGWRPRLK